MRVGRIACVTFAGLVALALALPVDAKGKGSGGSHNYGSSHSSASHGSSRSSHSSSRHSSRASPGYVVNHAQSLRRGGADSPSNMQWQTKGAAEAMDEVAKE